MIGGLGGAVAEVLAEEPGREVHFKRIGLPSAFAPRVGSQAYLEEQNGLTEEPVLREVERLLGMGRRDGPRGGPACS